MDFTIVILLLFWAFSAFAKAAKSKKADEEARRAKAPASSSEPSGTARPMRPADVDLPGQTTMPTHWDRPAYSPMVSSFEQLPSLEMNDSPVLRPSAQAEIRESKEQREADARPVHVTIPGLNISFDGDTLVKGVIFSEILTRPADRRSI